MERSVWIDEQVGQDGQLARMAQHFKTIARNPRLPLPLDQRR
jgi:hypothetical protein